MGFLLPLACPSRTPCVACRLRRLRLRHVLATRPTCIRVSAPWRLDTLPLSPPNPPLSLATSLGPKKVESSSISALLAVPSTQRASHTSQKPERSGGDPALGAERRTVSTPARHACNHTHSERLLNRHSDHRRPDDRTGIRSNEMLSYQARNRSSTPIVMTDVSVRDG
jgi:hypothetical protein